MLTHGFCVDEEGRKMSKSIGNVIDPDELVHGKKETPPPTDQQASTNSQGKKKKQQQQKKKKKKKAVDPAVTGYGADVCRLWAAASNYTTDVSIGETYVV